MVWLSDVVCSMLCGKTGEISVARIGINGFGRMGRLALRAGWQRAPLKFVQINEIGCDAQGSAHLLEFDSVHGRWPHACVSETEAVVVDGTAMSYSMQAELSAVDWSGCDIVIEATGKHHKRQDTLQDYFRQGVKKVLVAAPTDGALNVVYGVLAVTA